MRSGLTRCKTGSMRAKSLCVKSPRVCPFSIKFKSKWGLILKSPRTWSTISRCCAVRQTEVRNLLSFWAARTTGASFNASGRVPKTKRTRIFLLAMRFDFLEPGVFDDIIKKRQRVVQKSLITVKNTQTDDVIIGKTEKRLETYIAYPHRLSLPRHPARLKFRIKRELAQILFHGTRAVVHQIPRQFAYRALKHNFFMNGLIKPALALFEQQQDFFPPLASEFKFFAKEKIPPVNIKTVKRTAVARGLLNSILQFRVHHFIRVQRQYPVARGKAEGMIFLVREIVKLAAMHPGPELRRFFHGIVPAAPVHQNDFIRPRDGMQAIRYFVRFIGSYDGHGNFFHINPPSRKFRGPSVSVCSRPPGRPFAPKLWAAWE